MSSTSAKEITDMPYIETTDSTRLFYFDWGTGKPVVFIHGWAVGAESWEYQLKYFADQGFRAIAADTRGCGRSDDPGRNYDFDTLAEDLAAVLNKLDLTDVTLVTHSMGAGTASRYLSKYGSDRVEKAVFIAPTTPFLLKTEDNPNGIDKANFDQGLAALMDDRPHYLNAMAPAFFGADLPGFALSPEIQQWLVGLAQRASMQTSVGLYRTNTETDLRADVGRVTVPTHIIHADHDYGNPLELSSAATQRLIPGSTLTVYENAGHGLIITHKDRINREILEFILPSGMVSSPGVTMS